MKIENIKFKAKRLDNGEWVEGDLSHDFEGGFGISAVSEENGMVGFSGYFKVFLSTVCQFTGLTDMKGREIWEHDYITDYPNCGEVIYVDGGFAMHSNVGDLSLEQFVDRVEGSPLGTYGKCLVTNQGSIFDRKEGEV